MAHDKSLFNLVRHPLKLRTLTVKRVETLSPRMRRVTLSGPELEGFRSLAPEDHVKVFFPRPGEERPVLPTLGPLGLPLPTFGLKPVGRDYTPRRHDAIAGELDLDFYLHGDGAAARWAESAAPGQQLGVAGPRGSFVLTRSFDFHLFVGDETALPEFTRRIEELPAGNQALTVLVLQDIGEALPFESEASIESHWLVREATQPDARAALVRKLSELNVPEGEGFAWLAGEAGEMKAAYGALCKRGFPVARVHVSGHWKRGIVNHDHHEPVSLDAP